VLGPLFSASSLIFLIFFRLLLPPEFGAKEIVLPSLV